MKQRAAPPALMPVLHVRALPQPPAARDAAMTATCAAVAEAFRCPPSQVWATWETVERYAEGDAFAERQPAGTHPPVVELIAYQGRSPEQVRRALEGVAEALARTLGMEAGNAFVTYREAVAGAVFTGGAVR